MIPLYKHIIQPIEAGFLHAYEEDCESISVVINGRTFVLNYVQRGSTLEGYVYLFEDDTYEAHSKNRNPQIGDIVIEVEEGSVTVTNVVYPSIPYFALLINKDDNRQKVQLQSKVHVIDDTKPETNDNALVYFEVGEEDLHGFNEGDKLIFEIYRDDRKGYWTSKSPAFNVFETSIDDTATIFLHEGGQDE